MTDWSLKLATFLHDPPEKALILFHKSHEAKRDEILQEMGLQYDKRLDTADHIASAMQRLDIPEKFRMDNAKNCNEHICFKGPFRPVFKHTLSGEEQDFREINNYLAEFGYEELLKRCQFHPETVRRFFYENDWKNTYLALWRYLPEEYPLGYLLPADTRIPDHSIWDHLDITTAITSCLGDMGLFSLKIPAVQEFISQSRKLSDLWASSHIFSTIIFEGIKVIIDELGPDCIIYPHLRGNPMLDFFFAREKVISKRHNQKFQEQIRIANFPNTFLSFVPSSKAEELSKRIEERIRHKWKEIANIALSLLRVYGIHIDENLWNHQSNNTIEIFSTWLNFFNLDSFNDIKDNLPTNLRKMQETWLSFIKEVEKRSNYGHFYLLTYELLGILLKQKSSFWSTWIEEPKTSKCLMCGRRNTVIKRDSKGEYSYWNGNRWEDIKEVSRDFRFILKDRERLCSVCLIKRLYGWKRKSIFKEIFKVDPPRWESVVNVAAFDFIERAKADDQIRRAIRDYGVELIYKQEWKEEEFAKRLPSELKERFERLWETTGEPNKYYAILMMDGDRIGKVLSGENLPNFEEFLHPKFKRKILEWEKGRNLLNMKRMLTPSHHMAISRAMKDFSIHKVPEIIKKNYKGFLVYAGGDDILALFPTNEVLKAAKKLQDFFRSDFYEIEVNADKRKVMGLGKNMSMSAGIVFAHYKYPLYDVIEKVREAEKKAKNEYGRNAFYMTFIKHSGESSSAGGKWGFLDDLLPIAEAILQGKVSHRFIYDFMKTIQILNGELLKAEVKRLLKRRKTEKATDKDIDNIRDKIICLIEKYKENNLPIGDIGRAIKILFDAQRGEEG